MIVPVNTSVLLTCEVRFNGSYSVQWYRDSIHLVNDSTFSVVNNSNINLTLSVTDEYKPDTQIYCVMHDSATGSVITESDSITVNAVSEGTILLVCQ